MVVVEIEVVVAVVVVVLVQVVVVVVVVVLVVVVVVVAVVVAVVVVVVYIFPSGTREQPKHQRPAIVETQQYLSNQHGTCHCRGRQCAAGRESSSKAEPTPSCRKS